MSGERGDDGGEARRKIYDALAKTSVGALDFRGTGTTRARGANGEREGTTYR